MFSGDRFQNQDPGHIFILKNELLDSHARNREGKKKEQKFLLTKKSTDNGIGMISESYKHVGCC